LNEAKEAVLIAEKNGADPKKIKRVKKKLLKAENALERDVKVGDSKGKKRESLANFEITQKKEKAAEIKATKKVYGDSKETLSDNKSALRKKIAKVFLDTTKKAVSTIGKITKQGKVGELKNCVSKIQEAFKLTEVAFKKNEKSAIGDKRSMKVAIAKLELVEKLLDSTKATDDKILKEDINVIIDDLRNNEILLTRRKQRLAKAIRATKGPLEAYKIPLRHWENALKEVDYEEEKLDLLKVDLNKVTGELKVLHEEDLKTAIETHKLSIQKDLKDANDKSKKAVETVNSQIKELNELEKKKVLANDVKNASIIEANKQTKNHKDA